MYTRRSPFDVFDEMERAVENMRRSVGGVSLDSNLHTGTDGDDYVVVVDMPGFESEEIDLRFEDDSLYLEAHHEESAESDVGSTSRTRRVSERIRVPVEIDEDGISASYRNGVLEVRLPMLEVPDEEDESHRIDIE